MLLPLILAGAALAVLSKKKDGFKVGASYSAPKMRRVRRKDPKLGERDAIQRATEYLRSWGIRVPAFMHASSMYAWVENEIRVDKTYDPARYENEISRLEEARRILFPYTVREGNIPKASRPPTGYGAAQQSRFVR